MCEIRDNVRRLIQETTHLMHLSPSTRDSRNSVRVINIPPDAPGKSHFLFHFHTDTRLLYKSWEMLPQCSSCVIFDF